MSKTILFDLDGVLTLPEEMFSNMYAGSRGYDVEPFSNFFQNDWAEFVTGKKDLKQHIEENPQLWKWDGTAEEFMRYWFESEDVKNESLLTAIVELRSRGIPCYIATEQEQYRTDYIRDVMFRGDFDGIFSTAEIGYKKNDSRFFEAILKSLNLKPADVLFFDDSQSKLDAANALGIQTHLYTSVQDTVETIEANV